MAEQGFSVMFFLFADREFHGKIARMNNHYQTNQNNRSYSHSYRSYLHEYALKAN